jgi:hypothetical protein
MLKKYLEPSFLEELECSLLGLESKLAKRLNATKANCMLPAAYNATLLCLH